MDGQDDVWEHRDEIRNELKERFDPDAATLGTVMERIEEARRPENLPNYSHWEEPEKLGEDLQSFARGHGLRAGWNTWIGIQEPDTSHLTIDAGRKSSD